MSKQRGGWSGTWMVVTALLAGCGGDDSKSVDDFLPEIPAPTGGTPSAFAGQITGAGDVIPGPASFGLVGDYFMKNDVARFVIQAEGRVPGIVPHGGNLVDAVMLDSAGKDLTPDHFGELSAFYHVARTCEHTSMEVTQDGSGGGAAVLRARGRSAINGFINMKGLGILRIPEEIEPDVEDNLECVTTYVLEPGSTVLDVHWTYFNAGDAKVTGPFGTFNDTGGETEVFAPARGYERLGLSAIAALGDPAPIDYVVYQGPGVAYGIVPRYETATTNSQFAISGISIMLYGAEKLLDLLDADAWVFRLEPGEGLTNRVSIVLGRDAAAVEERFATWNGTQLRTIAGSIASGPSGGRVGIYIDANSDGVLDDDDPVRTYADVDGAGAFSARVAPGRYLVRAQIKDESGSQTVVVDASSADVTGLSLDLPAPIVYDYTIVDDATGEPVPGRIQAIGAHPASPDSRLFETFDRLAGVVRTVHAAHGTSVDLGDGADPPLVLPAPGSYRIYVSRGTEWSVADMKLTPTVGEQPAALTFRIRRVVPTPGYLSTEFHQHSVGSPDSPVSRERRVATFAAEGIEFFASTDHDYVTDFQPIIESMGLQRVMRSIPGIEVTPFSYGHFQAFPLQVDLDDPSRGAIDWAKGNNGYAMIPAEIFADARSRGAEVIQVNHPRVTASDFSDLMRYFDRTGLVFDYENRVIAGDHLAAPVPNEWMRLPEDTIWSDRFDALEVWNGFTMKESNDDGVREIGQLDVVLRDWFNFLSFGFEVTPIGNSDSHTAVKDPVGMPRTYVRVPDDSAAALTTAGIIDDVLDTLAGRSGVARDVIITNGPHIEISVAGHAGSPLGRVIDGSAGSVTLNIRVIAPEWAEMDTVELFVNSTPDSDEKTETWLQPAQCMTTRDLTGLAVTDPCALATLGATAMTIARVEVGTGFYRWEGTAQITIAASSIASLTRTGARGGDAWLVVRVRGGKAIFPVMTQDALAAGNVATFIDGSPSEIDAALRGVGIPAAAVTSPIYVDFDGGGYRAPFAP